MCELLTVVEARSKVLLFSKILQALSETPACIREMSDASGDLVCAPTGAMTELASIVAVAMVVIIAKITGHCALMPGSNLGQDGA